MNEAILDPMDLKIMDVDAFIAKVGALEVTSSAIHATGSYEFHPDGLFSERIFGEVGKSERLTTFGWISLNNRFVTPRLYGSLLKLNSLYGNIASGSIYAKWDDEIKDFVQCNDDDGKTGMAFLLKYIDKVQPKRNTSVSRNRMIDNLNKYRDHMFIDKMLVLPAGLRDVVEKNGREAYNDINDIYLPIIHLSNALKDAGNSNPMFDQLRRAMQTKLVDVEQFLLNVIGGKGGFAQAAYGSRNVALGTRNVISATDITSNSPNDKSMLRSDEVLVPLFQAVNMFKPLIAYRIRKMFAEFVFDSESDSATLVDTKTYESVHVDISPKVKSKFMTADGIDSMIKIFRNNHNKFSSVLVTSVDGKQYGLWMIYKYEGKMWLTRSKDELKARLKESDIPYKSDNLHILNYMEMFYMAMYATLDRYAMVTRFPVTHADSTLMSKVHLATTSKYEKMVLINPNDTNEYDRWPVRGSDIVGAMSLHAMHLDLYNGDHDGDTVSAIGVLSDEGTKECAEYNNSPRSVVSPTGTPTIGLSTDMSKAMLTSLTMDIGYH